MRFLELRIPPPAVALVVGVAMWFGARFGPSLELSRSVRVAAFIAIAIAGAAIAVAGNREFRRMGTTVNPMRPENAALLVTSGIFRFTRNPMYLGLALILFGWAAFLCSAAALAGPFIFMFYIDRFQIRPEEEVLRAKFGHAYAAYTARARRWL